jgi:hypothetical protein
MENPDVEAGLIMMEKFWDALAPALSTTVRVNLKVPGLVGVPEITLWVEFSVSPGGSDPPNDQLYGGLPPVAETVTE